MRLTYVLSWFPGVLIAIANGTLREFVYRTYWEELLSHQLSVISFIALFGAYVWFVIPLLKLTSKAEAIRLGSVWLAMTVGFEHVFGHFVMGHPWSILLHDYNVFEGRLWVLVLAWTLVSPSLAYRFHRPTPQAAI